MDKNKTTRELSEAEFAQVEDLLDARDRATKRGTPERTAFDQLRSGWEACYALPDRTAAERRARREAICAYAIANQLVQS